MVFVDLVLVRTQLHEHFYRLDLPRKHRKVEWRVVRVCTELGIDVCSRLLQRK